MALQEDIKAYRLEYLCMTQADAAKAYGVSANAWARWETGLNAPVRAKGLKLRRDIRDWKERTGR